MPRIFRPCPAQPGRIKSTLADVGEKSVAERACFLCPPNLPEEQKGILYRKDYLILCNPMPVFSSHFTISHLDHRPQELAGTVATLLTLLCDFGPGFLILYNGPGCGASAPDHLHFQAVPSGLMPIEGEIRATQRASGRRAGMFPCIGREAWDGKSSYSKEPSRLRWGMRFTLSCRDLRACSSRTGSR